MATPPTGPPDRAVSPSPSAAAGRRASGVSRFWADDMSGAPLHSERPALCGQPGSDDQMTTGGTIFRSVWSLMSQQSGGHHTGATPWLIELPVTRVAGDRVQPFAGDFHPRVWPVRRRESGRPTHAGLEVSAAGDTRASISSQGGGWRRCVCLRRAFEFPDRARGLTVWRRVSACTVPPDWQMWSLGTQAALQPGRN